MVTDWLTGCVVIVIPVELFTVKVAAVLVMLPAMFETITSNVAPLSDATAAGLI
jgi:hypothetical protein